MNFRKGFQGFRVSGFQGWCFWARTWVVERFYFSSPFLIVLLFFAGISLFSNGCFDPREGCLDIAATNFNPAADKDCCCRYPNLILTTDQVYDTLVFRRDSLYKGTGGHLFKIRSIVFYLSDFQLFKGSDAFETSDLIELKTYDSVNKDTLKTMFRDDVTLLRRTPLDNTIGSFREDGDFDKIRFRLGLPANVETVIPALAPTTHPLHTQPENLAQNGYVFLQAIVVRDSMAGTAEDTLNFRRADLGDFFFEGTGSFRHKTGYDFKLTLQADWSKLFQGVIWTTPDIPAWKNQIVANLPSVFSVSQ